VEKGVSWPWLTRGQPPAVSVSSPKLVELKFISETMEGESSSFSGRERNYTRRSDPIGIIGRRDLIYWNSVHCRRYPSARCPSGDSGRENWECPKTSDSARMLGTGNIPS
jgi:hypothetical protein